jgi:hypothetical protein
MDRITHQSPRQRGYESTSSLRNDSLTHTRKHERRREESNQETKQPGSAGLSGHAGRIIRKGRADCPAGYRGLSAPLLRTVRPEPRTTEKATRTSRDAPRITNRPRGARGVSARHPRTVRQALADCPPNTRGPSETSPNKNSKTPQIESEAEQEHEENAANMPGADRPLGPRGPSARHGQSRKLLDLQGQHLQSITGSPKR